MIFNYLSNSIIPVIILIIIIYGVTEKVKVFDVFMEGAKEGVEIVIKIFPTLLGIFMAVVVFRNSGIITLIERGIEGILKLLYIPTEVLPLLLVRPISGSAALAVSIDIMKEFGPDSKIGLIASTIMGATETTFYTIALYAGVIKVKKTRYVIVSSLTADFMAMYGAVAFWQFLSKSFY